jgi:hypothetical protein
MEALGPNPAAAVRWRPRGEAGLRLLLGWTNRTRATEDAARRIGIVLEQQGVQYVPPPTQIDQAMQIALYGLFERVSTLEDRLAGPPATPPPPAAAANIPPNDDAAAAMARGIAPAAGGGTRRHRRRRRT